MKILPVGGDSFNAGGRTDTTKVVVGFCSIADAPENERRHKCTTSLM